MVQGQITLNSRIFFIIPRISPVFISFFTFPWFYVSYIASPSPCLGFMSDIPLTHINPFINRIIRNHVGKLVKPSTGSFQRGDTVYSILHEQSSSVILSLSQESIPYPPVKQEALYSLEPRACWARTKSCPCWLLVYWIEIRMDFL